MSSHISTWLSRLVPRLQTPGKEGAIGPSLIGLVVVALLPLLLFGAGVTSWIVDQKREAVATELASTASALRVAVDRELAMHFAAMAVLTSNDSLESNDLASFQRHARRALATRPNWRNVGLIDTLTHQIVTGWPEVPHPLAISIAPAVVDEVARTGMPRVAGVFMASKITAGPIILLMSPLPGGNMQRYVLGVAIDPNSVSDIFRDQRLKTSWTGAVIDGAMNLAARSRDPDRFVGKRATPSLIAAIAKSERGLFTAITQEGKTVYTSFDRSPVTGWSLVLGVPAAEVEGPIRNLLIVVALAGAALMAVALTLTTFVGRAIVRRRDAYELELHESRARAEASLREFSDLVHRVPLGVFKFRLRKDGGARFDFVSPTWCRQMGVSAEQVYKDADLAVTHLQLDDKAELFRLTRDASTTLNGVYWEGRMTGPFEGRSLHIESTPTRLEGGDVLFDGVSQDITERKNLEDQVIRQALHDTLTDLPNRRLLVDRLRHAVARVRRSQSYGAVLYLDLDNFKPLNDRNGHDAGDLLLQAVAERLQTCVRASDTVARIGGDEFVVLLPDLDGQPGPAVLQAQLVADKIIAALSQGYRLTLTSDDQGHHVIDHACSASVGIAMFAGDDSQPEDVLRSADSAMYHAKRAGGNRSCVFASPASTPGTDS